MRIQALTKEFESNFLSSEKLTIGPVREYRGVLRDASSGGLDCVPESDAAELCRVDERDRRGSGRLETIVWRGRT